MSKSKAIYGVAYGSVVEECGSIEQARERARAILQAAPPVDRADPAGDAEVDVVELQGAGPVFASDGDEISPCHAPRRTIDTWTWPRLEIYLEGR